MTDYLYIGANGYDNKGVWGEAGAGVGAKGLYVYGFDQTAGTASYLGQADENIRVGDLCVDSARRVLYATDRVARNPFLSSERTPQATGGGGVFAWRADEAGNLALLNRQHSFGPLPGSLVLSRDRRYLLVANHGEEAPPANVVARGNRGWEMRRVFSTTATICLQLGEEGALGNGVGIVEHPSISQEENEFKQFYAHPSCTGISPHTDAFMTCDNRCDNFYWFALDESSGKLDALASPVYQEIASGPLHFAWHPSQQLLYCVNSRAPTLDIYRYDGAGGMSRVAGVDALEVDMTDRNTSFTQGQLLFGADGRHLYSLGSVAHATGRSAERAGFLNVFAVATDGSLSAQQSLELSAVEPRGLALSPNGRWLVVTSPYDNTFVVVLIGVDGVAVEYATHDLPGAYRAVFIAEKPEGTANATGTADAAGNAGEGDAANEGTGEQATGGSTNATEDGAGATGTAERTTGTGATGDGTGAQATRARSAGRGEQNGKAQQYETRSRQRGERSRQRGQRGEQGVGPRGQQREETPLDQTRSQQRGEPQRHETQPQRHEETRNGRT
jgi:6-phosphogluconolactonase